HGRAHSDRTPWRGGYPELVLAPGCARPGSPGCAWCSRRVVTEADYVDGRGTTADSRGAPAVHRRQALPEARVRRLLRHVGADRLAAPVDPHRRGHKAHEQGASLLSV